MFFTTTAPEAVAERQVALLERSHGCRVVGWSSRLADRAGLTQDLEGAEAYDVLLTEIKAAAVDVASERAVAAGAQVIFTDNAAVGVGGTDLPAAFADMLDLARERRDQR